MGHYGNRRVGTVLQQVAINFFCIRQGALRCLTVVVIQWQQIAQWG